MGDFTLPFLLPFSLPVTFALPKMIANMQSMAALVFECRQMASYSTPRR